MARHGYRTDTDQAMALAYRRARATGKTHYVYGTALGYAVTPIAPPSSQARFEYWPQDRADGAVAEYVRPNLQRGTQTRQAISA